MSDLVGNPEERFSRIAAHTWKVQVRRSAFNIQSKGLQENYDNSGK